MGELAQAGSPFSCRDKYPMSTLTVETGAGLPDANSYATVAEADDYHALRENDAWEAAEPSKKAAALVRATDYLNAFYHAPHCPLLATQAMTWPTIVDDGLPARVKTATITLALDALAGPLSGPASRGIKSTTESLEGVVSEQTVYDDEAPADPYPAITAMLAPIAFLRGPNMITMGNLDL